MKQGGIPVLLGIHTSGGDGENGGLKLNSELLKWIYSFKKGGESFHSQPYFWKQKFLDVEAKARLDFGKDGEANEAHKTLEIIKESTVGEESVGKEEKISEEEYT